MVTTEDLNFELVLYINNSKVVRIPCNFLLYDPVSSVVSFFVGDTHPYTHVSIEKDGQTLFKKSFI